MDDEGCVITIPSYVTKQDDGSKDSYTAYSIVITLKGQEWKSSVRYSTFRQLHDTVKRRFPSIRLPKLPPKKLMGNGSEEFLDKRRNELEVYLRDLLSVPLIRTSDEVSRVLELSSRIDAPASPSTSPFSSPPPSSGTSASVLSSSAGADRPVASPRSAYEDSSYSTSESAHSSTYDVPPQRAVATYDFDGDLTHNQLCFRVDDVIYIVSQDDPEATGWWWGEKEDGSQGYFPCDFIRMLDDEPQQENLQTEPVEEITEPESRARSDPAPASPSPVVERQSPRAGQQPPVVVAGSPSPQPAVRAGRPVPPDRPKFDVATKKPPPPVPARGGGAATAATAATASPPPGAPAGLASGAAPPAAQLFGNASASSMSKKSASLPALATTAQLSSKSFIDGQGQARPGLGRPKPPAGSLSTRLRAPSDAQQSSPISPRGPGSPVMPRGPLGGGSDPRNNPISPRSPFSSVGARPLPGIAVGPPGAALRPAVPQRSGRGDSSPENRGADKKDRRTMIATEILTTERTYVEGLKWLAEEYKPVLIKLNEDGTASVPDAVIKKIFSNVEIIRSLNRTFMNDLEKRMATWDAESTQVGDLFKGLAPYLKMYKDYSNNFGTASDTCQQIREHHVINAALDGVKAKCQSLTIEALLITPIQRLPRYNLLIQDLLRNTPETHPDYNNLGDALRSTKEIADYINDSIRQAEQSAKFRNLATQGEQFRRLLEAHRTLVMEGKVTLAERRSKSQWMICLFNDIFVPAKLQRGEIMPQLTVPLTLTWLSPEVKGVKEPAFEIVTPERTFVFVVATPQEKQNWVKAIAEGIQNNIQNKVVDGDSTKRQATYSYSTGGEFTGQWQLGKRHGSGRLEYFNGNVYEGAWQEDMRHGHGTLIYSTGEVYEGEWANDKKEGQGTMSYNGASYVGTWKDGLRSGSGTITFANGDVFEGKFVGDKAHGKGKLRYYNGGIFEGFFEDDRKHGLGTFKCGKASYQGNWVNGRKEGTGTMTYGDGSTYQGNWHDDKRHGAGKFTEEDGAEYVGDWVRDVREGRGIYTSSNGDVYEGLWKEDKRNGHGILLTKESHKYEGEWANGRRQGKGTMTFAGGDKYEGAWLNDRPHGNGLWTSGDGSKYEGKWTNGARDGKCTVTPPAKTKDAVFQGVCKDNAITGTGDKVFELAPAAPDINML